MSKEFDKARKWRRAPSGENDWRKEDTTNPLAGRHIHLEPTLPEQQVPTA